MIRILVVGGGASGMTAAISAAGDNSSVTIYEKNDRIGKKILATGNGKCNLTNLNFGTDCYYVKNTEQLSRYFQRFSVLDTLRFFKNIGLLLRERDGYVYPYCEQASVVLDILRKTLVQKGVRVETEVTDLKIKWQNHKFHVSSSLGKEEFDRVILASGSVASMKHSDLSGYELAKQFSHHCIPLVPALVQVRCRENFFKSVSGVRARATVSVLNKNRVLLQEKGELQLTAYGVSGIPVFQISREIAYLLKANEKLKILIDFLPEYEKVDWQNLSLKRIEENMGQTVGDCLLGTIHKKLVTLLCKNHGLKESDTVSLKNKKELYEIFKEMKAFTVTPESVNPFENAQVCAGGIPLNEVDDNLQSRFQKGLYFCGEILDVDGKCGGYNLQWAWTSGSIAGKEAAK